MVLAEPPLQRIFYAPGATAADANCTGARENPGVCSVVAESVLVKQQLLILNWLAAAVTQSVLFRCVSRFLRRKPSLLQTPRVRTQFAQKRLGPQWRLQIHAERLTAAWCPEGQCIEPET
jgi:hypothetical protein